MRKTDYVRRAERRMARAEAMANATITRAIQRLLTVLEHERTEYLIYLDRLRKRVFR